MTTKEDILHVLSTVLHPETGQGLPEGGFVKDVAVADGHISVVLKFRRAKDPFSSSLVRQTSTVLGSAFPGAEVSVTVDSPRAANPVSDARSRRLPGVCKIVAVASGKGGVGKSTLTAHLAATLVGKGYRIGVLDADIYGPSQPQLFGVGNYLPVAATSTGSDTESTVEQILPAESMGVKIMSIGFFIDPGDALVWRGPMATGALKQLIHQTAWGELDVLLIDMPPGTGDVHLTIAHELEIDGALVVSTPQRLAIADVRRGIEMFRSEGIDVPILGIVENMAWFTPAELPSNRYYIFGKGGARSLAAAEGVDFLGDVPIVLSETDSGDKGLPTTGIQPEAAPFYVDIAAAIVDKLKL